MAVSSSGKKSANKTEYSFPSVVLFKTATLGCENNRAWLVNDQSELIAAINEILKDKTGYVPLTNFSVDTKIRQYCQTGLEGGEVFIKKLIYNGAEKQTHNWDV